MGLNDPFFIRYFRYIGGILKGDMGESYITHRNVFQTFMGRLNMTLLLGGSALIFACIISIPLGIYTALHQNTWKDTAAMIVALFGVSMPNFWLGLMLILLFSLKLVPDPAGCHGRPWSGGFADTYDPERHAGRPASGLYDHGESQRGIPQQGHL